MRRSRRFRHGGARFYKNIAHSQEIHTHNTRTHGMETGIVSDPDWIFFFGLFCRCWSS